MSMTADEVIKWAEAVAKAHPNYRIICDYSGTYIEIAPRNPDES
jgi:hypothetical protein